MKRKIEDEEVHQSDEEEIDTVKSKKPVLSVNTEFAERIENLSGLKFAAAVVENSKEVSQLFNSISKIDATYSQNIQNKFNAVCAKYSTAEKRDKLFRKVKTDFSCEGDLFKNFLKYGMREAENDNFGVCLAKMLASLFEIGASVGEIKSPVVGIQMIVSHSKATDIFLESHTLRKIKFPKDEPLPQPTYSLIKVELLRIWLALVNSFTKISKSSGTEDDKKILENSVPYLLQMYDATLGTADKIIFEIIKMYSSKKLGISMETMPLFGPKSLETPPPGAANPIYAHSTRANSVLELVSEPKAFQTAIHYGEAGWDDTQSSEYYDMRFLLPLLCNVLDEKNICNGALVISNGWIYFIARGLGSDDSVIRSISFLAYRRLILNFLTSRGYRLQDVKIWLHFLQSVKRGFTQLGECKLSNLLSVWMVYTWEVIRQASHSMYPRVTHFLLAKPIIELTIFPEFMAFYNACDGNKESREWITDILSNGLRSTEDWKIAQKLPTVKFLCSSFLLEQAKTRKTILEILSRGATLPEMAEELIDKHSLPLWISNLALNDKNLNEGLETLFQNLVTFSTPNSCRSYLFKFVALKHSWCYAQ